MSSKPLLPQNDPDVGKRTRQLTSSRREYIYNYAYVRPLAMADGVPLDALPTLKWGIKVGFRLLEILRNKIKLFRTSIFDLHELKLGKLLGKLRLFTSKGFKKEMRSMVNSRKGVDAMVNPFLKEFGLKQLKGAGNSLQEYNDQFQSIRLPDIAHDFREDSVFAYMRIGGPNPLVIEGISKVDANFPVTDKIFKSVKGFAKDSLAKAGRENRLYLADYKRLTVLKPGNFPNGKKFPAAPKALFAIPSGQKKGLLKPIAIQCGQDPKKFKIFTPNDGTAWQMAKTTVQMADGNYHEAVSHLGRTHLLIEPIVVATHRQLAENHPLNILLLPHFEGTVFINYLAQAKLISPKGPVDKLLSGTISSTRKLAVEALDLDFSFNDSMLPNDLKKRRTTNSKLFYPYRDDSLKIWKAIHNWVSSYLGVYYRTEGAIANDNELQNWAADIVSRAGGRVHGFGEPEGEIKTREYLYDAVTMIIFTASVQHAAVNFPQNNIMSYTPAMPLATYSPPPDKKRMPASAWIKSLPPLDISELQLSVGYLLGGIYYTQLGDYQWRHFVDKRVAPFLDQFQERLESIEDEIKVRNEKTLNQGGIPYEYLLPSAVPQSINI
jgi:arachidonate 15-lipoxygenase